MQPSRMMRALALSTLVVLLGCSEQQAPSGEAAAPKEGTAWWKTDGQVQAVGGTGGPAGEPLPGWGKLPAIDPALAASGKALYDAKGCNACHSIGKGQVVGPDLLGLTHRAEPDWVKRFIKDPTPMFESDARAKELLGQFLVKMPSLGLTDDEVGALVDYLRSEDATLAAGQKSTEE